MPYGEFRALRRATGVSPPAHEKLLKKFYQNFHIGCGAKIIVYCRFPFQTPKNVEKTSKKLLQIFKNLFTNQKCCGIISVNDVSSVLGSKAVLHRSSPTVY
jgi:hypothetical protein